MSSSSPSSTRACWDVVVALFLHVLAPIEGKSPEEIIDKWTELMSGVISRHATRLLKLRVDEIEGVCTRSRRRARRGRRCG